MKITGPKELAKAYAELYHDELISPNNTPEHCLEQIENAVGFWLRDYIKNPENQIRNSNWYGKVTKALFNALKIKQPKTVKKMLEVLLEDE